MTDQSWNPNDYQFDFPPVTSEGKLTDLPIHRKIYHVYNYIVELITEIRMCICINAELSGLFLCLASVDYLAGFYKGCKTNSDDYKEIIQQYFPQEYHQYKEAIYSQLRCGLMHNLVAVDPWGKKSISFIIHPYSKDHLTKTPEGKLIFSVHHFMIDICRAWNMYAHNLIMKPEKHKELLKKFHTRFNKLEGMGAFMNKDPDQVHQQGNTYIADINK
jgi:hypothetical protein